MTQENRQDLAHRADDEDDATFVKPLSGEEAAALFNEEAAETARPVIPLSEQPARAPIVVPVPRREPAPGARRSWLVGLVLASTLVGALLGGLALRLYQKSRSASAAAPAAEQQTAQEAAAASQPVEPQPVAAHEESKEDVRPALPAPTQEEEAASLDDEAEEREEASRRRPDDTDDEEEQLRRPAVHEDEDRGARKRGKRGDSEEEDRPRRSAKSSGPSRRDRPEPRLVDVITTSRRVRQRVERPRAEQSRDRLRAIFEGQPPE